MKKHLPFDPDAYSFAPVVKCDGEWHIFDFTERYDPELIRKTKWGIGRFNEKRSGMYIAPQYKNERNIHMGIDFWTPAYEPVYVFYKGEIVYIKNNDREGDYGPTIVTKHILGGTKLFALYGHLTKGSLKELHSGQTIVKGQPIAVVGDRTENGGWEPHLHFQLSLEDPGEADMPGVVSEKNRPNALEKFPDPRSIVGNIY